MSGESTTLPAAIPVMSGETLPIGIDFALLLQSGQTLTAPTGSLYDITNGSPGSPVTLGSATVSGTVVTATVTSLVAGKTYRLVLGATAATGVIWQSGLIINCPF